MIKSRSLTALGVAVIAGAQLFWISSTTAAEPVKGGSFKVHLNSDIGGFDHIKVPRGGMSRYQALFGIHELLFNYDPKTGKISPALAIKAEHENDYKLWRVTLRKGVKFSNGKELTTEAYVHHFNRLLSHRLAGRFRAELGPRLEKVTAVDKHVMEFHFSQPHVGFDVIMGSPKYVWFLNEPGFAKENEKTPDYNTKAVGAGPYMLKEWNPGKGFVLVRNPNYWNPSAQYADEITYLVAPGPEVAIQWPKLQAGDVDASMTFGDLIVRGRKETKKLNFQEGWRQTLAWSLNFNLEKEPFNDIRVRQALTHAIDRKTLVKIFTRGGGRVAQEGFEPESVWHCGNIKYPAFDQAKAKKLLQEYGKPIPKFELWTRGVPSYRRVAEVLQGMWRKIGIDVDIKVGARGPTSLVNRVNRGELGAWILVVGQNIHPTVFTTEMHSKNKVNQWHIKSPKVDAALDGLFAARGFDSIKKSHCEFEQAKSQELPYVPFAYGMLSIFSQKNIGGLTPPSSVVAGFHKMYRTK